MPTLTPAEVAKDLRVSTSTALQYIKAGNLPGFKVGARWRIEVRDFEAWKEARKIESGAWDPYLVEPGSPAHLAIVANTTARAARDEVYGLGLRSRRSQAAFDRRRA